MEFKFSSHTDARAAQVVRALYEVARIATISGATEQDVKTICAAAEQLGASLVPKLHPGVVEHLRREAKEGLSVAARLVSGNPVISESLGLVSSELLAATSRELAVDFDSEVRPRPSGEAADKSVDTDAKSASTIDNLLTSSEPLIDLFRLPKPRGEERPPSYAPDDVTAVLWTVTPVFADGIAQLDINVDSWTKAELAKQVSGNPETVRYSWSVAELPRSGTALLIPTALDTEMVSLNVEAPGQRGFRVDLRRSPAGQYALAAFPEIAPDCTITATFVRSGSFVASKPRIENFRLPVAEAFTLATRELDFSEGDKITEAQKLMNSVPWLSVADADMEDLSRLLGRFPGRAMEFLSGFKGGSFTALHVLHAAHLAKVGLSSRLALCVHPNYPSEKPKLRLLVERSDGSYLVDLSDHFDRSLAAFGEEGADAAENLSRILSKRKHELELPNEPYKAGLALRERVLKAQPDQPSNEAFGAGNPFGASRNLDGFQDDSRRVDGSPSAVDLSDHDRVYLKHLKENGPLMMQSLEAAMLAVTRDSDPRLLLEWCERTQGYWYQSELNPKQFTVADPYLLDGFGFAKDWRRQTRLFMDYLRDSYPAQYKQLPRVMAHAIWRSRSSENDADSVTRVKLFNWAKCAKYSYRELLEIAKDLRNEVLSPNYTQNLMGQSTTFLLALLGEVGRFTDWAAPGEVSRNDPQSQLCSDRLWRELVRRVPQMRGNFAEMAKVAELLDKCGYFGERHAPTILPLLRQCPGLVGVAYAAVELSSHRYPEFNSIFDIEVLKVTTGLSDKPLEEFIMKERLQAFLGLISVGNYGLARSCINGRTGRNSKRERPGAGTLLDLSSIAASAEVISLLRLAEERAVPMPTPNNSISLLIRVEDQDGLGFLIDLMARANGLPKTGAPSATEKVLRGVTNWPEVLRGTERINGFRYTVRDLRVGTMVSYALSDSKWVALIGCELLRVSKGEFASDVGMVIEARNTGGAIKRSLKEIGDYVQDEINRRESEEFSYGARGMRIFNRSRVLDDALRALNGGRKVSHAPHSALVRLRQSDEGALDIRETRAYQDVRKFAETGAPSEASEAVLGSFPREKRRLAALTMTLDAYWSEMPTDYRDFVLRPRKVNSLAEEILSTTDKSPLPTQSDFRELLIKRRRRQRAELIDPSRPLNNLELREPSRATRRKGSDGDVTEMRIAAEGEVFDPRTVNHRATAREGLSRLVINQRQRPSNPAPVLLVDLARFVSIEVYGLQGSHLEQVFQVQLAAQRIFERLREAPHVVFALDGVVGEKITAKDVQNLFKSPYHLFLRLYEATRSVYAWGMNHQVHFKLTDPIRLISSSPVPVLPNPELIKLARARAPVFGLVHTSNREQTAAAFTRYGVRVSLFD